MQEREVYYRDGQSRSSTDLLKEKYRPFNLDEPPTLTHKVFDYYQDLVWATLSRAEIQ